MLAGSRIDMTTPQLSGRQAQFGQTLAFAERTMSEVLRRHLAERRIVPETWYALKLVATRGPGLTREAMTRDLAGSRTLDADSTRELLARLETEGLLRGGAELDLTAEGETLYRSLQEYVSEATVRLLGQLDADDVDTTVRTLQAVTALAAESLATS
jgi:DNA-binding MarR family transcriptional regulator